MVVGSKTRNFDNAYAWDITICTSGTRPTAYDGRPIYETDTDKFLIYDGTSWEEVGGGAGVTDHGALTGLADDDHTQYLLVAGTRAMSGNLQMGDNDITGADTLQATASQNLTLKVSTGSSIVFQAV